MTAVVDTHTHLDSLPDADAAVAAARAAGVGGIVSIGCSPESIRATIDIAARHDGVVRVGAGVHPQQASTFDLERWPEVEELAADPAVVAIGETGFDQYRDYGPIEAQQELFVRHAALARRLDLPLVIHTRVAERHTLDALARHADGLTVVLHCFSLPAQIDEVLERGYCCSFAGNVTYKSAGDLREAAARLPRERLLVETDAPYLAPVPKRGRPNEPAYVVHTLAAIAEARGDSLEEAARYTTDNAARIFRLQPAEVPAGTAGPLGRGA